MRKEFDVVAAWSVDRFGRSLQNLLGFLAELQAKRVDLYLHQQGLDTQTAAGRAMFQMCGVFAEFERAMIVSRVKAGRAREGQRGPPRAAPRAGGCASSQGAAGLGAVPASDLEVHGLGGGNPPPAHFHHQRASARARRAP
jgi:DNA invertase Pin-like site-specific DNA recombinase